MLQLRPYQLEIARAVMDSILKPRAHLFRGNRPPGREKRAFRAYRAPFLTMFMVRGGSAVKCSPTFKPQTVISMQRLKQRLDKDTLYVAGIDIAGEAEVGEELELTVQGRDATVITVAGLAPRAEGPLINVVEHYCWVGRKHERLFPQMVDLLRDTWG